MFCKYCGKEIPEGESCFCEKAVNERTTGSPQAAAKENIWLHSLKSLPTSLKNLFKDCTGKGNSIYTSVYFTAISFIFYLVFFLLGFNTVFQGADGFVGQAFLDTLLTVVLVHGLSILLAIIGQLIRKEKVTVTEAFIRSACISVFPATVLLLAGISSTFSLKLAFILIFFALFIRFAEITTLCASEFGKVKSNLVPYLISAALCLLVGYIIVIIIKNNVEAVFYSNTIGSLWRF